MKGRAERTAAVHVPRPSCRLGRGVYRQQATHANAPDARPIQQSWSLHWRRPASSSSFHPVRRSVLARSVFASRPGRRRRVPTGDGRLLSPSRLRRRAARTNGPGHAVLQIRRICLYLPYRKGRQNCINSVGHFYFVKSDAAKQLPTSPGASPGPLGDSGKIRVPRLRRPNLFLLLRP